MTAMTLPVIELGRSELATFAASAEREWLVTNGLGGYAAGSIGGARTRRYHGLLVAALKPPVERTVLVAKLDATARYRGASSRSAATSMPTARSTRAASSGSSASSSKGKRPCGST